MSAAAPPTPAPARRTLHQWDVGAFWAQMERERSTHAGSIVCFHIPMEKNDVKVRASKL